jgi:hypothetical protein
MAHFKCVACRTRQYGAARPPGLVGDLCPGCGSPLEPVGELAEVFGFRHVESRQEAAGFDSRFDRVDSARDERNERERLRDEARYRRERLDLYRARLYGGRATSQGKLRALQRASDGATARLHRAEASAPSPHPST